MSGEQQACALAYQTCEHSRLILVCVERDAEMEVVSEEESFPNRRIGAYAPITPFSSTTTTGFSHKLIIVLGYVSTTKRAPASGAETS